MEHQSASVHFFLEMEQTLLKTKNNYTNIDINDFESLINIFYVYHMSYFFWALPESHLSSLARLLADYFNR